MIINKKNISLIISIFFFIGLAYITYLYIGRTTIGNNFTVMNAEGLDEQVMTEIVTNQWYSSLFFSEWSEPLFAYPLSYKLTKSSLEISYPRVIATPKTIFASHDPQLFLSPQVNNWEKKTILESDISSVLVKLCSLKGCVKVRFVHGSPSLVLKSDNDQTFLLSGKIQAVNTDKGINRIITDRGTYVLISTTTPSVEFITNDKEVKVNMPADSMMILAIEPDEGSIPLHEWSNTINQVIFSYRTEGANSYSELQYFGPNKEVLVTGLTDMEAGDNAIKLGTYESIRGKLTLWKTEKLKRKIPLVVGLETQQMLSNLSNDEKEELLRRLKSDVSELSNRPIREGVYFGGKDILRLTILYDIAHELKDYDSITALESVLIPELTNRLRLRSTGLENWYLDKQTSPSGVLARVPEFGHEFFNDHHFHYGYYILSASMIIKENPELLNELRPGIDALVTDIANTDGTNGYPWVRGFDAYLGHSWADGRGTSADGNNQESTSEAVLRWYSLLRWATVIKDTDLLVLAQSGLAIESNAAKTYWLGYQPEIFSFPEGYLSPIASLVWGGKSDYATWFSSRDSHIIGIQFLPVTHVLTYALDNDSWIRLRNNYSSTKSAEDWNDIWAMVAAMHGEKVPERWDNYESGNSATWYYLWTKYWDNASSLSQ